MRGGKQSFKAPGKAIARLGSSDHPLRDGGGVVYRTPRGPVLWFTRGQNEVFDTSPFVYIHRIPLYSTRKAFERAYPDVRGDLRTIEGRLQAIAHAINTVGARRFDPRPIAIKVK